MKHLLLPLCIGTASCALQQSQVPSDKKVQKQPNILFVFTDDQQFNGYEANGNDLIKTPFLNKLTERVVRFTNAHAALSLCSPSRAAVLTGHYGSTNGVESLAAPLKRGEVTFSEKIGSLSMKNIKLSDQALKYLNTANTFL